MIAWRWLVVIACVYADGSQVQSGCKLSAEQQPEILTLLQVETAIQPSKNVSGTLEPHVRSSEDGNGGHAKFEWWLLLFRVSLLTLAMILAHGWLFRPWKSVFVLLIPLGTAAFAAFSACGSGLPDSRGRMNLVVFEKSCSVAAWTVLLTLLTSMCVASAPEEAAWPLSGVRRFLRQFRNFRLSVWPQVVLYMALAVSILEGVLGDLTHQCYLNAVTGLCLVVCLPLPGAGLFQYPSEWIRKYDMAAMQAELQGLDLSDEDLRPRISDWYVCLMETKTGRRFADMCCRLPVSWVWLYTSWNALFLFDISALNGWTLAVLLAPLLESQRTLCLLQSHGVALIPWMNSHWLQVRAFSLWLWLVLNGCFHPLFGNISSPSDWFELTPHDEDQARRMWGAFNLAWAILHLGWFWHRIYRLNQLSQAETEQRSMPKDSLASG
ncbi:Gnf1 [Symbiodinium natans]|uniref:Gnf1 protein n=1 Tax=Symbiodinium natans TaxID=878477 RepID=A0A812HHK2_9DINO|nr:Gnf1 [Symbiodinium natans]